ncbi:MAG: 4Fe-4S dicluster domain-containing protein [Phycisphaerae bacterium]
MLPQILNKDQVPLFVKSLQQIYRVVGPVVKEKGFYDYSVIDQPDELAMDYNITVQSAKKFFYPPFETLLNYVKNQNQDELQMAVEAPRTVLFGVHPCDIYATWLLDDVFGKDPKDPYYLARRNRAVMIALDCLKPCDEKQFCLDMGSLYVQQGFDIMLTDLGNRYYVEVASELGENLVNQSDVFFQATAKDHAAHQQAQLAKQSSFKNKIPYETKYLPEMLEQSYDSLIWDANARRCFSCGSCNLICPTCYCFDMSDEDQINLKEGSRVRRWDGCQLKNFAEVAGGENFRVSAGSRLRHRLMRKGRYMRMVYGKSGCVGCGRCDRNCTVGISVLRTYQQIATT